MKRTDQQLLPHLFRQEFARMTAVLCRHFGLRHIEIAEDIASDTFLKASEEWAIKGVPKNPEAWLYTVAKNKVRDYFRHVSVFENRIRTNLIAEGISGDDSLVWDDQILADSQLAMMFAVCNPADSCAGQIALALQVLCGFSVEEIAGAFLSKPETIRKRLQRARKKLRNNHFQIHELSENAIRSRLDVVLKTLYLLFNEGYFSKSGDQLIRKELCSEAVRLTLLLTEHANTNTPETNALLALMCFQSSRLEARISLNGETILFENQDRELWDKDLIEKGNYYLVNSCTGDEVSRYHLEAGIAYWHTASEHNQKWNHILNLYDQLLKKEYSPVMALNRAFAFSKVHGHKAAIIEVQGLVLGETTYYHALLGYLYAHQDTDLAVRHYERAIQFSESVVEQQTLEREKQQILANQPVLNYSSGNFE